MTDRSTAQQDRWNGKSNKRNFQQQVTERHISNLDPNDTSSHEEFNPNFETNCNIQALWVRTTEFVNKSVQYPEKKPIKLFRKKCFHCIPKLVGHLWSRSSQSFSDSHRSKPESSKIDVVDKESFDEIFKSRYEEISSICHDPECKIQRSAVALSQNRIMPDNTSSNSFNMAKEAPTVPLVKVKNYENFDKHCETQSVDDVTSQNSGATEILFNNLDDKKSLCNIMGNDAKISPSEPTLPGKKQTDEKEPEIESILSADPMDTPNGSISLRSPSIQTETSSNRTLPPTYSAIAQELFMRCNNPDNASHRNVILSRIGNLRPTRPFLGRHPPPTYAESMNVDMAAPLFSASSPFWGPRPSAVICHVCGEFTITETKGRISRSTHTVACFLCFCLCWPCCLIPYFSPSCKNVEHYCTRCRALLGTYRPM